MAVITVAKDTFQTQVLDDKGVVFVDYYADWCGPCRFTSPIIDELAEDSEYKTKVKFVKIDVDQNQELAEKYNIKLASRFHNLPALEISRDLSQKSKERLNSCRRTN